MREFRGRSSYYEQESSQPPQTDNTITLTRPVPLQMSPEKAIFPFLRLSGEIRNQIYLEILGPKLPKPPPLLSPLPRTWRRPSDSGDCERYFWFDRKFNTALFLLNRQINQEFMDVMWNNLGVEWHVDTFELDPKDTSRLEAMNRLQRCKLILHSHPTYHCFPAKSVMRQTPHSRYDLTAWALDIELTVWGLGHKLNRMPHLKQVHVDYTEEEDTWEDGYWLRFRDRSLVQFFGPELKTVLSTDLGGIKNVTVTGTLCDECAALVASAIERPKEKLAEAYMQESENVSQEKLFPNGATRPAVGYEPPPCLTYCGHEQSLQKWRSVKEARKGDIRPRSIEYSRRMSLVA
ncbi:MAG: hypothetical protein Q9181_001663 [Wetmoreana brouardii]